MIADRLTQKHSGIQRKFLDYPDAGHGIITPYDGASYHPVGGFWCRLGGTKESNMHASHDAWKTVLEFLAE